MTTEKKQEYFINFDQTVENLDNDIHRLHKLLSEFQPSIQTPPVLIIQVKLPRIAKEQELVSTAC